MPHTPRAARTPSDTTPADPRPVPERILAAAMDLVRKQGLQGLSQGRVAAAAGVRQGHLTYYFPTRKDLIKAIATVIYAEVAEAMSAVAPAGGASAASYEEVREFFAQRIREPLLARLMLALMNVTDEDPDLCRWLAEHRADLIARLRAVFARLELHPSEDELLLFHASLVGAAFLGVQASTDAATARAAHLARMAFDHLVRSASAAGRMECVPARAGVRS